MTGKKSEPKDQQGTLIDNPKTILPEEKNTTEIVDVEKQLKELAEENRQRAKQIRQLQNSLERIATRLEAMRVAEYVETFEKPWKLIVNNLIAGAARGLGFAIGTTVILAILIAFIRQLIAANIPFLTDLLRQLISLVKSS